MSMTLDLAALIKSAPAVPTVTIPPGVYTIPPLRALTPPSMVRIICAGVTFPDLQLIGCSNLSFEGLTVQQPPTTDDNIKTVLLQNCSHVTLAGFAVLGAQTGIPHGHAIVMSGGDDLVIKDSEIAWFFKGVTFDGCSDGTVSGCNLHHHRTSAINGFGQRPTVADSHIHDLMFVAPTDHHDGIHFFTKGRTVPMDGVTIVRNRLEAAFATGASGVNLEGSPGSWFTNVTMTDNEMAWNGNQGVSLDYVETGEFRRNKLLPAPGLQDPKQAPAFIVQNRRLGPPPALSITGNTSKKIAAFDSAYGVNTVLTAAQIAAYGAAP